MRKTEFANDEYYHIYNRGVDKREVFCEERDYLRFLISMREFKKKELIESLYRLNQIKREETEFLRLLRNRRNSVSLVEIITYCLNPNHYHFILKQLINNGIEKFMHKLGLGYTKYFNAKNDRSGALFQGPFQAKHIDTNEYLLWLSGYVNGNAEIHKIAKAEDYKWGSYQDYLELRKGTLCNKEIILDQFKNIKDYQEYVEMVIEESRKRKDLEEYFIEEI